MRIGFDGRFIRHRQTGNGMFTQQLVEGLARLDDKNRYVVYMLEDNPFIKKDNFHLKQMSRLHARSHLRFLLTFPLEFYRNPVDIFHAIYSVPLRTRSRIVLSLVEFSWFTRPEYFPRLLLSQFRMMTRLSIRRADRIITPTHIGKEQVLDYFGLPEEKVEVIHFGFNEFFLEPCAPEDIDRVKQRHGITGDYILTAGDLHPRKNLVRTIEAFNWLKETQKVPHSLVLVGKDSWQAEQVHREASACSASDSIIFTGYVPLEELRALYQGATVFAFPSLDEGFGLPVHEAMASRVPVIVSDRGALPEVAGDAAVFVDPLSVEDIACAVYRVLDSPTVREELIKKGLKQIKAFSWEQSCRKTMRLYQDVYAAGCEERRPH